MSEPQPPLGDEAAHVAAYLRWYRATVVAKARSLPEQEVRRPVLPSGWTVLELLQHLAHMERRWFVWGFLGEQVDEPWGDRSPDGERWHVPAGRSVDDVVDLLEQVARRTEEVLAGHDLTATAAVGGRFDDTPPGPPDLRWTCFHVLQEYARHAGHLDVVVELAGGPTGE